MRRALRFGADFGAIQVALAGFLLRGGIVLILAPSAVLPSVIDVAGATGVDAFGIDGRPTPWVFEMAAIISVAAALWLVLAFMLGSLIDVWLIDAALDEDGHSTDRSRPLPELGLLLDLAGIRAICLMPLVGAAVWASSGIYNAIYDELTVPSNLATPLALRVIENAAGPILVVGLAWLATEVVAAIAVRRLVLFNTGIWRSIGGAFTQIARRPISSASTAVVSFGSSIVAIGLAMAATATAFDWCRVAARNPVPVVITIGARPLTPDVRLAVFMLAVAAIGVAWIAALILSGIASAWRSAAFTGETAAAVPNARTEPQGPGLGLSGPASERSGD